MPNNLAEFKRPEAESAVESEEAKRKQLEADEVLETKLKEASKPREERGVPFQAHPSSQHLETANQIIRPRPEVKITETEETGLPPAEHEELMANPVEWINKTISNPKLSAYEQMLGVIEATETNEKREEAA